MSGGDNPSRDSAPGATQFRPREAVAGAPADEESREPCPSPLSWQQVLDGFRAESESWEVDRGRYALRGRSCGDGPPLYFLNGFSGTHELHALLVWLLREEFRCVVYDYPGGDPSAAGGAPPAVDEYADDLLAIADFHGDAQFALWGSSFGAAVALSAAALRPDRVSRMALLCGFARRRLTWFERLLVAALWGSKRTLVQLPGREWFQLQNHRAWFPPFDETRWRFFVENSGSAPLATLARRAWAVRAFDLRPRLAAIEQPVLLIRTEGEGRVASILQDELARGLPRAGSEWLHSSGHLAYLTHPHRVSKLVKPFFQGVDSLVAETVGNA